MGKKWLTGALLIGVLALNIGAVGSNGKSGPLPPQAPGVASSSGDSGQPAETAGNAEEPVPMTDIHGIKPPEPAGFDPTPLYFAAIGAAVLALAVFSFFLWKHRRKRLRVRTVPGLSPEETALAALDELTDVEALEGKGFYFRLSAVLRRYIQNRFGVNAPEMTTEELLPETRKLGMDPDLRQGLKSLLQTADPIKFAEFPASVRAMEDHLLFARRFVKETTPVSASE